MRTSRAEALVELRKAVGRLLATDDQLVHCRERVHEAFREHRVTAEAVEHRTQAEIERESAIDGIRLAESILREAERGEEAAS